VKGNLVYSTWLKGGLHVADISDPANPVEVGEFRSPDNKGPLLSDVALYGDYALASAVWGSGLYVVKLQLAKAVPTITPTPLDATATPTPTPTATLAPAEISEAQQSTAAPLPDNVRLIAEWGSSGSGDGQLSNPNGIALDGSGNVYVADSFNGRVQVFSSSGEFLTKWGSLGSGDGQSRWLFDIAVDRAIDGGGNVYVVDSFNDRVQVFSSKGDFLRKWGSPGSGDRQFNEPHGIAVDSAGHVYVADHFNDRVQKFGPNGNLLATWGSVAPVGIAVDGAGNVYVTDFSNSRVQVFSPSGQLLRQWGSPGTGDGQLNNPAAIAVDGAGNVYVTDWGNNRVQVFSADGGFLTKWGSAVERASSADPAGSRLIRQDTST